MSLRPDRANPSRRPQEYVAKGAAQAKCPWNDPAPASCRPDSKRPDVNSQRGGASAHPNAPIQRGVVKNYRAPRTKSARLKKGFAFRWEKLDLITACFGFQGFWTASTWPHHPSHSRWRAVASNAVDVLNRSYLPVAAACAVRASNAATCCSPAAGRCAPLPTPDREASCCQRR